MTIKHLEFTKTYGPYAVGDVAGFSPDRAQYLEDMGVAHQKEWELAPEPGSVANAVKSPRKASQVRGDNGNAS